MLNDYQTFGYSANIDFSVDKSIKEVVLNQNKMEEFSRTLIQAIDMKLHKIDGKESFLIDKWAGDDHPQTFGVSACGFLTTTLLFGVKTPPANRGFWRHKGGGGFLHRYGDFPRFSQNY